MTARQLYEEYMVPKNLEEHMLRVAALAEILLDNWKGQEVDKKAIITCCIFHDIAKPMNFALAKQAAFGMPPEEIAKLGKLQERLRNLYGSDEHQATVAICQEINLSPAAVKCVNNLEWKFIPRLLKDGEIESLIPIYCDMRIGPKGILPLGERLKELKARTSAEDYKANVSNGKALEELVKKGVEIDLDTITDGQINNHFTNLLSIEI